LSPVIKVAALFGLFSTMLVQLLGQTRIFYSMSRDGLLPPVFAMVHPRFRTPHVSTILTGLVIALMAGLTPIAVLGQLVSIGTLLAFVLVSIGVIILRKTAPDVPRPFRTPWVPVVTILGAAICLAQMVGLPLATWERLLIWLAIGLVVYFSYSRRSRTFVVVAAGFYGAKASAGRRRSPEGLALRGRERRANPIRTRER
jgi:APA family basic amino acid/polyamine antiporter